MSPSQIQTDSKASQTVRPMCKILTMMCDSPNTFKIRKTMMTVLVNLLKVQQEPLLQVRTQSSVGSGCRLHFSEL